MDFSKILTISLVLAAAAAPALCGRSRCANQISGKVVPVETHYLYKDKAPVTENGLTGGPVTNDRGHIRNVGTSDASIDIYLPKKGKASGQMVIIFPGGGYGFLSALQEGSYVAEWFNGRGVAAAVLKYRLPNWHCTVPTEDFEEAFRYCRAHSQEWGVKSIGVIGFSAGGHFASTVATHLKGETRPDFQILIYPVVTAGEGTHWGSREHLLGKNPSQELVDLYSNEKQVCSVTPPAFIAFSDDDTVVPPATNAVPYFRALTENGVPATVVSYPSGGHGWGFPKEGENDALAPQYRASFYAALEAWLKTL